MKAKHVMSTTRPDNVPETLNGNRFVGVYRGYIIRFGGISYSVPQLRERGLAWESHAIRVINKHCRKQEARA